MKCRSVGSDQQIAVHELCQPDIDHLAAESGYARDSFQQLRVTLAAGQIDEANHSAARERGQRAGQQGARGQLQDVLTP